MPHEFLPALRVVTSPFDPLPLILRTSHFAAAAALAWLALGLGVALSQQPAKPPAPGKTFNGRVEGHIEGRSEAGLPVVLLQYRLNAEGQPEGGPIARTQTAEGGAYLFENVPVQADTVYRLGTRIEGRLIASDPFTFPKDATKVLFNLRLPSVRKDLSVLSAQELLWVAEPRPGSVWITEVIHLSNASPDVADTHEPPLSVPIPADAQDFEMLRLDDENGQTERLGERLLIRARFAPGLGVMAFRYRLPAWFGAASWTRAYPFAAARMRVLSPGGSVLAEGAGFSEAPPETFQDVSYTVWARESLAAGTPVTVRLSGIPILQVLLLAPLVGFAVLMGGIVFWFLKRRLGSPATQTPAAQTPGSAGT
jgi:hypothetical protein